MSNYNPNPDLFGWRGFSFHTSEDEEVRNLAERKARISNWSAPQPEYERSTMDRVFSMFGAPQQFLFKLTQEIAEDGFQVSDVWRSLSHGANYFNPMSNAQYIDPDEIRQIFMGPSAEGARRTFGESSVNLGISLLYDPLWFLPGVGAARGAGMISQGTATALQKVINPGSLAFDAARVAAQGAGRAGQAALSATVGAERASEITTGASRWWVDRMAGVEGGAREIMERMGVTVNAHQREAYKTLKEVEKLHPEAQTLLARMVESEAFRTAKFAAPSEKAVKDAGLAIGRVQVAPDAGRTLRQSQVDEVQSLLKEADQKGISKDLLIDAYDNIQRISMGITDDLVRRGAITPTEHAETFGLYLRRLYTAAEDPRAAYSRVESLISRAESGADPQALQYLRDMQVYDPLKTRANLMQAAEKINEASVGVLRIRGEGGKFISPTTEGAGQFFTRDGTSGRFKFNVDEFLSHIGEYSRENPLASITDMLDHVSTTVFKGQRLPTEFGELLTNSLTNGFSEVKGLKSWSQAFSEWGPQSSVGFKNWQLNLDQISKREPIPEFIRKQVLGEIESVAPRLVGTTQIGGRQAALAGVFDELSGAVRVTPEMQTVVREAMRNKQGIPDEVVEQVARQLGKNIDDPAVAAAIKNLAGSTSDASAWSLLGNADTRWASSNRTDVHTVYLGKAESLGSMSDKWTTPGIAAVLNNHKKMLDIASGLAPDKANNIIADSLASLTRFFKFSKIVLDPGANVRDTVSSVLQVAITTDTPFSMANLAKSFRISSDYMKGVSSQYHQIANRVGYELGGFGYYQSELRDVGREMAKMVERTSRSEAGKKTLFDTMVDAMAPVNKGLEKLENVASAQYQFRENVFRTYVFSSTYDDLAAKALKVGEDVSSVAVQDRLGRQAAAMTDRALFNYADVPLAVEWARKYGAAPFLTFPYKAAPQLVNVLYEKPYKVLKYQRGVTEWNSFWAGGSEALAAEIAALPEHKRDAMVVRLPFSDVDDNPLFMDLSYFLPWYVINDLAKDASAIGGMFTGPQGDFEGSRREIMGDPGMRGGIFSPVFSQLYDAIIHNRDGLGRPVWDPTATTDQKIFSIGRYMYQFMAPPTFPGGSTSDSVGRALQAVARTSPEPVDWLDWVGTGARTMGAIQSPADALNRYGERPVTRALVGGAANIQGLGNFVSGGLIPPPDENTNTNPSMQLLGGLASLFVNVTASDASRQTRNELTQAKLTNTELQRRIAQVYANPNMDTARKTQEVERLLELGRQNLLIANTNILRMRPPQ